MAKSKTQAIRDAASRTYGDRNKRLAYLGFLSYSDYIASPLWASIRGRVLARTSACFACGQRATQVHHTRYETRDLNGSDLTHLISVCHACHSRAEWKGTLKLDPDRATARLVTWRAERLSGKPFRLARPKAPARPKRKAKAKPMIKPKSRDALLDALIEAASLTAKDAKAQRKAEVKPKAKPNAGPMTETRKSRRQAADKTRKSASIVVHPDALSVVMFRRRARG